MFMFTQVARHELQDNYRIFRSLNHQQTLQLWKNKALNSTAPNPALTTAHIL